MIGKPITGKSFGGCVRYVVDKKDAVILDANGVRMQNAYLITQDLNQQRKTRPGLGKAVGHLVLSWSNEDLPKLSDQIMVERAKEYMEKMNIRNTQYVMVRHHDGKNPHMHIIYNRVDNKGNTISDNNSYGQNIKACKEITLKHGYHLGKGKEQVNRHALTGKEKSRYELFDAIKSALKQSVSWKGLESNLQAKGIQIDFKMRSGTNEVQGISFEKDGFKMKGSAIDRTFSYCNLNAQLNFNQQREQQRIACIENSPSVAHQIREVLRTNYQHDSQPVFSGGKNLLEILLSPEFAPAQSGDQDDAKIYRKKKKKKTGQQTDQEQSNGISR
ncbi:Relaxase [Pedobacter cryoconitis]|uniref:Relaxase n=1 Tax=Pedobacter cryoconitis TaxID=188932 RepID=A0A127V981_9SPHI|nr:relaxase/mobilization nuclease domain-containing protein [Pedobacter cryoconitis]AMP97886.1 Relaxase [Pedobacter cryoconitis]